MSAPTLFDATPAEGQRPPLGEYTRIPKQTHGPFLPEIAARALGNLGPEWEWRQVDSIHASRPWIHPYRARALALGVGR